MKPSSFIIIDNDPISNNICELIIKATYNTDAKVYKFTSSEEGLEFVRSGNYFTDNTYAVLLLDISMPVLNGWEFLERFKSVDAAIKNKVKIYIITTSTNYQDRIRAAENEYVVDYIVKPLSNNTIVELIAKFQ